MKKLFTAIQKNDIVTVKTLLNKSPELISCTLKGTPKKYDGQSPLQVALKDSNTEMIELLLEYHPDVNFIGDESCANTWRAPVIHDAINRAIMYSRWNVNRLDGLEVYNTKEEADAAIARIKDIVAEPEVGQIYKGTVSGMKDFGLFVKIMNGFEAMVHISEITGERIAKIEDTKIKEGDTVYVRYLGADKRGKTRMSMVGIDQKTGEEIKK